MKHILKLYVTGQTPNSLKALKNLRDICKKANLNDKELEVEVIDIIKNPKLAEDDRIVAIPTLVKELPTPVQKIVGDLSNHEKVLLGLNLVGKNE